MQDKDYYEILQVSPDANSDLIQAAYRARCKEYHPDTGLPTASAERMVLINEAYAVLSNRKRRAVYDATYTRARDQKGPRGGSPHGRPQPDAGT